MSKISCKNPDNNFLRKQSTKFDQIALHTTVQTECYLSGEKTMLREGQESSFTVNMLGAAKWDIK